MTTGKGEIGRWTQGLDHFLDLRMSSKLMISDWKEPVRPTVNQNEMMIDFVICLNRLAEESDDRMKRLSYRSAAHAGVHGVLEQAADGVNVSTSDEEIEELEEVKEEWKDG
jgi:hypothetical protein